MDDWSRPPFYGEKLNRKRSALPRQTVFTCYGVAGSRTSESGLPYMALAICHPALAGAAFSLAGTSDGKYGDSRAERP